ncbi:MAG: N-acetylmuramoyl-L-alanine amidase [Chthoniobacteraceae bacterium]
MKRRILSIFAPIFSGAARHGMPCVGLIVLLGCFSFLIVPEDNFLPGPIGTGWAANRVLPANGTPTVVIDPGHGGIDDGTKFFGLAEKDMTLDVAQRLERLLKKFPINVVLTRHSDVYVSLPQRAQIANRIADTNKNVIYVSIHFNQSSAEYVNGIETYYADQKIPDPTDWTWVGFFSRSEDDGPLDLGENLAACMQNAMVSQMQETNRGIKSRSLYVCRHTRMPAVLVEGGFLSNKIENQLLRNDGYRDRIAQGLAAGILGYLQTMHGVPALHITPPPPHLAAGATPRTADISHD